MTTGPAVLFTAFEPSGDALAAAVIARLRADRPGLPIFALGGERMAAAGAHILEHSTLKPTMFLDSVAQVFSHRRRVKRLEAFLRQQPIALHVPTDSPAANWSICAAVRHLQPQAKILHLAAPQLWAWAPWRIKKLRRLTDRVLCLLPFEPQWFEQRGVAAEFIGHPVFERPRGRPPDDPPKRIALLPGSRRSEVQRNWPTLLSVFERLCVAHPGLQGCVAAAHEPAQQQVRQITAQRARGSGGWPRSLDMRVHQADEVLDWADLALVVSGTATLQVAAHRKPMVVLFNASWWTWNLAGRFIIHTRTFSLPNLICAPPGSDGPHVVPEFVPHFGQVEPVFAAVDELIRLPRARAAQQRAIEQIGRFYAGKACTQTAAEVLLRALPESTAKPAP